MTQADLDRNEIIEMARQIATQASKVGPYRTWTHEYAMSLIMQLVDASAAKEREACAKVCEQLSNAKDVGYAGVGSLKCADAIRSKNIIECAPQTVVTEDGFSNWVCPKPIGYLMQCCDCGLIHEAEFRVAKYKDEGSDEFDIVDDVNIQSQFRMRRFEQ